MYSINIGIIDGSLPTKLMKIEARPIVISSINKLITPSVIQ